jgi:hypothetical protein
MMTPGSVGAAAAPVRSGAAETLSNVAFLRAKQLQGGARCHLEANGHKPTHLAVLEVLADTISWSAA